MFKSTFANDGVSIWIKRLAPSICLLVLVVFLAKFFVGDKWLSQVKNVSLSLWIILLLFSTMNYLIRTYRWRLLFGACGVKLTWKTTFFSYFSGFAMAATPGKIGEFIRMWLIHKVEKIPYKKSIYPLVGDRIADLVAILIFASIGLASFNKMFVPFSIAVLITSILIFFWLFPKLVSDKIFKTLKYLKIRSLTVIKIKRLINSEARHINSTSALLIIIVSLSAWLMEGIAFWLLLKSFGLDIPFAMSISIFCLSVLVGALSMLPGGLGGTEIAMVTMLTLSGVDMPIAVAVTAIIRAVTLWYAIVLGLITLPIALKNT